MDNFVNTISFSTAEDQDSIEVINGILIKPVKLEDLILSTHSIPVLIKIYHTEWKILNIPQSVNQYYPIVLCRKPRTVLYGKYNISDQIFTITIATKKHTPLTVKNIILPIFTPNIVPVLRQCKRMMGTPFGYLAEIFKDIAMAIKPSISRPKNYDPYKNIDDHEAKICTVRFGLLGALFFVMPGICYLLSRLMSGNFTGYYYLISLFSFFPLHMRYQCKYRRKINGIYFLYKLITGRGF